MMDNLKNMNIIGVRLRQKRLEKGLSLQGLGDLVDMTRAGIGQIERGKTKAPTPENLFKIAKALACDPEWLATGKKAKPTNKDHLIAKIKDFSFKEISMIDSYIKFIISQRD